jgi:type I restriction enzyme, S subunit
MSEVPDSWIHTHLADVAQWGSGGTPSRTNAAYYGGDIPWIKTGELGQGLITDTEEKITGLGLKNSSAKVFPKGSVAVAMYGATIGKTAILGIDAATNQACAVGIPENSVTTTEYLLYYLASQKDDFVKAGQGGAQPNISQAVIKNWPIPLAPLNEQKRIADKLDRLLAKVDNCRERLDLISLALTRFRQSILNAAISGKLSEDWRNEKGLSNKWRKVKLSEVATSRLGKMLDKLKNQGDLVPYLRNTNVRWFDFDLSDVKGLRAGKEELSSLFIRKGDVLICEGGEPGRCAIWKGEDDIYVYQKALHRVRVGDQLSQEWLCYCIKASADSGKLSKFFSGTTIKHLTSIAFKQFELDLPPINEQKEIVRRVEKLFDFADRLEARYQTARAQIDKLTPALLDKAFKGELVPQDPTDEPAAALLAKIQPISAKPKAKRKSKAN